VLEYRTSVVVEVYRLRCPEWGAGSEKIAQLPSNAHSVGEACESAAGSAVRVSGKHGAAERRKPALR
jgi:hypothetical protein